MQPAFLVARLSVTLSSVWQDATLLRYANVESLLPVVQQVVRGEAFNCQIPYHEVPSLLASVAPTIGQRRDLRFTQWRRARNTPHAAGRFRVLLRHEPAVLRPARHRRPQADWPGRNASAIRRQVVVVFQEVRRLLRDDGTLWLSIGDSYCGSSQVGGTGKETITGGKRNQQATMHSQTWHRPGGKPKDLLGIPWRVAFALQADGWYLRSEIIWHAPNKMPESVTDRPTRSHEHLFLLAKSAAYHYDAKAIQEDAVSGGTRNKRSVWTVPTARFKGAHFSTSPPKLIEPCILAGCPVGGTVLDPFSGVCTTGKVAKQLRRNYIGIELNATYHEMARQRLGV